MGDNRETSVVRGYHEATSHTHFSVHASGHFLDWTTQPIPFKIYEDLPPIPLAPHFAAIDRNLLECLLPEHVPAGGPLTLQQLAQILFYTAGVTRVRRRADGQPFCFRAAACTGALYEIDLYVACGDLGSEVAAGLYHFSPHDFSLRRLRSGDVRRAVIDACAAAEHADAFVICGATYWRNAWKYQARTWRHFGWDNGTMLANLLTAANAVDQPASVLCGFVDDALHHLAGLDPVHEAAYSVVAMGRADRPPPPCDVRALPTLALRTKPLSSSEVDYPLMRQAQAASSLNDVAAVKQWRAGVKPQKREPRGTPLPPSADSSRTLHDVVTRRGSTRQFARVPIEAGDLSTLLRCSAARVPADWQPFGMRLNELYLIVNDVTGFEPGAWRYDVDAVELLRPGHFRSEAEYLDLEQPLAGDAAVNVYYMMDLNALLERFGNRGYRAAQLEAGILGGRIYLAAYALRFGATGLTFFDEDVTRFFSPWAEGLTPTFLVAAGRSIKR